MYLLPFRSLAYFSLHVFLKVWEILCTSHRKYWNNLHFSKWLLVTQRENYQCCYSVWSTMTVGCSLLLFDWYYWINMQWDLQNSLYSTSINSILRIFLCVCGGEGWMIGKSCHEHIKILDQVDLVKFYEGALALFAPVNKCEGVS